MSLGVNNVPYKTCSYSCVYCQLGRTINLIAERRVFFDPEEIVREVARALASGRADYVTFVPDGEPTLDINLGREIVGVKELVSVPVAVLTNSSLLFLEDVRADLSNADLVSLKVDTVDESLWKRLNRPHPKLKLSRVLEGIEVFSREFSGKIITETMIVENLNSSVDVLEPVAEFIRESVKPEKAYLSIPIRPPAEPFVRAPPAEKLVEAFELFARKIGRDRVELLNMPEPPHFHPSGDPASWLLRVVSVHPMRLDYALDSLREKSEDPEAIIRDLESRGEIRLVEYEGKLFIIRNYKTREKRA